VGQLGPAVLEPEQELQQEVYPLGLQQEVDLLEVRMVAGH
jgi:hypothetical protein